MILEIIRFVVATPGVEYVHTFIKIAVAIVKTTLSPMNQLNSVNTMNLYCNLMQPHTNYIDQSPLAVLHSKPHLLTRHWAEISLKSFLIVTRMYTWHSMPRLFQNCCFAALQKQPNH